MNKKFEPYLDEYYRRTGELGYWGGAYYTSGFVNYLINKFVPQTDEEPKERAKQQHLTSASTPLCGNCTSCGAEYTEGGFCRHLSSCKL
jgi:hypothetical protein